MKTEEGQRAPGEGREGREGQRQRIRRVQSHHYVVCRKEGKLNRNGDREVSRNRLQRACPAEWAFHETAEEEGVKEGEL